MPSLSRRLNQMTFITLKLGFFISLEVFIFAIMNEKINKTLAAAINRVISNNSDYINKLSCRLLSSALYYELLLLKMNYHEFEKTELNIVGDSSYNGISWTHYWIRFGDLYIDLARKQFGDYPCPYIWPVEEGIKRIIWPITTDGKEIHLPTEAKIIF